MARGGREKRRAARGGSQRSGSRRESFSSENTQDGSRRGGMHRDGANGNAGESVRIGQSARIAIAFGVFAVFALLIFLKLFDLQVIKASEYSAMAETERTASYDIDPHRGTIYDRNGNALAISVDAVTVYANPSELKGIEELAALQVSKVYGGETTDYADTIKNSASDTFVYLVRKGDCDKAEKLEALLEEQGITGVYFLDDVRREYPYGQTGGQVIGFCNADGEGISGIEAYYDDVLKGQKGRRVVERGVDGTPIAGRTSEDVAAIDGQDIMIALDIELQAYVEERLLQDKEGLTANGGTAIVMDASTGEIYAAASLPLFNPADVANSESGSDQLKCITQAIEPGSVFKSVSAITALICGSMGVEDTIECPAELEADGYIITDAEDRDDTVYTLREIINYSSNVGISLVTEKTGFEPFYNNILNFKLNELTRVDYPGESNGYLLDFSKWSRMQGYSASFGQGLSTTPLQITRFYGALVNKGVACTPHFLITKLQTGEKVKWSSEEIISDQTAISNMNSMLETVVTDGTGKKAAIDGYSVAGKTSTAEIASESGGYEDDVYNVAFVGFINGSNSELVCYTGAYRTPWESVTTLVFRDIMTYAIDRYRIAPV